MKKDKKKRGSVFSLLVKNYILFTLLLIFAINAIIIVSVLRIAGIIMDVSPKQVTEYQEVLSAKRYAEFPVERLLGKTGHIVIMNQDGEIIYKSSDTAPGNHFSAQELKYIPNFQDDSQVEVTTLHTEENRTLTSVSFSTHMADKTVQNVLYLFDDNLNVAYSTVKDYSTAFSKREFELLTNQFSEEYSIRKYAYINLSGEQETMLLYSPHTNDDTFFGRIGQTFRDAVIGFILIYFVAIVLFILWLNYKIRKPLLLFKETLNAFTTGTRESYLSYKGPKEFVEICDSFNEMSLRLYESEKRQEKLQQEKQKMLADISHDLKTPITVIGGYATALNEGIISDEEKPLYLATIAQKADALDDLINVFYEYSKLEHPDYALTLEAVDVCIFLRDYMAEKYNDLSLTGFELEVNIPEKHILCRLDKIQLRRAFENIITNSIKHNEKGTCLYCVLSQQDNEVHITLADNGCGIPIEIGQNVFEPFTVGEKSRNHSGSGLGLSITQKIIEAHGGTICLVEPPTGEYKTEFAIFLPIGNK